MATNLKGYTNSKIKQKGAVALVTAVVLLLAITLIVLFASRVTIMEQRVSANDARAKMAVASAERGLAIASNNLKAKSPGEIKALGWTQCVDGDTSKDSCGDGSANVFDAAWWHYTPVAADNLDNDCTENNENGYCIKYFTQTPNDKYAAFTIISDGHADTGLANAMVTQTISKYNFRDSGNGAVPPVMTPTPTIGGNMTIVANPNASGLAGRNNPISIWAENAMAFGGAGSIQTCGELHDDNGNEGSTKCIAPGINDELDRSLTSFNQCACAISDTAPAYTETNTNIGRDVVAPEDVDFPFPDNMFDYFFGTADWTEIKEQADKVIDSCDQDPKLGPDTSGLIWVEGDCTIGGSTLDTTNVPAAIAPSKFLGSRFMGTGTVPEYGNGPLILVVEGDFAVTSNNVHIWGVVFVINEENGYGTLYKTDSEVSLTGGPVIHGALLSDTELDFGGGSMTVMYDPEMFRALEANNDDDTNNAWDRLIPVKGSWNDLYPSFD